MKLHRTTGQPDWADSPANQRTLWQQIAVSTNGVITVGNALTMIGLILVIYGLIEIIAHHFYMGGSLLVVGRLCDLADGWLADLTGTKSPLGELLDAVVDKIGTFTTVIALFFAGVASWWLLISLLLPHILIAAVIALKRRQNIHLHPSRIGKLSMAAAWVGLVGLVLISAMNIEWPQPIVVAIYTIIATSFVAGIYTLIGYMQQGN